MNERKNLEKRFVFIQLDMPLYYFPKTVVCVFFIDFSVAVYVLRNKIYKIKVVAAIYERCIVHFVLASEMVVQGGFLYFQKIGDVLKGCCTGAFIKCTE